MGAHAPECPFDDPDQRVAAEPHGIRDFRDRPPLKIPEPQHRPLVVRQAFQCLLQGGLGFALNQPLTGCFRGVGRCFDGAAGAFETGRTSPRMEVIANGVADVVLVDLAQPGHKLCRLCSLEIRNLLVGRQAGLLHEIGGVDATPNPFVDEPIREPMQFRSLRVQQLAERSNIPALGAEE
mgnify:FL=1